MTSTQSGARLAGALVLVGSLLGLVSEASAVSTVTAVSSNADWHLVASMSGRMMGLTGDASGNLLSFDTSQNLFQLPATGLASAMSANAPIPNSSFVLLATSSNSGSWIAGIAPLSDGTTLFDNGTSNEIDLVTSPGTATPAYVNGWLDAPQGMTLDPSGTALYVANTAAHTVVRVPRVGGAFDWAAGATIVSGLNYPTQVQVDANGDLYIADLNDMAIYEMTASAVAGVVGGGSPVTPASGLVTRASGPDLHGVNGLALDPSGNVFFSLYHGETLSNGGIFTIGEVPASWSTSQPATLANGGVIDVADTSSSPAIDSGEQPLAIVNGVLYTGSWNSDKIYGYRLGSVARVSNLSVTLSGGNLVASWSPGGSQSYTCTLLYGFNAPSKFTVTTTSSNCVFYNVGNMPYGVRVSVNGSPSSVTAWATPLRTILCVRGSVHRKVTGANPRCPAGFTQR